MGRSSGKYTILESILYDMYIVEYCIYHDVT